MEAAAVSASTAFIMNGDPVREKRVRSVGLQVVNPRESPNVL
jgi:hypothetical protein